MGRFHDIHDFLLRKVEWEKKNHICVVDIMIFENIVEAMLQSSIERMGSREGAGRRCREAEDCNRIDINLICM